MNTHHHGDHVGGNEVFKQFAMIVAHDNVRTRMLASPADDPSATTRRDSRRRRRPATSRWSSSSRTDRLGEEGQDRGDPGSGHDLRLGASHPSMGDETIQIWHLPPAHTDGDSVVFFEKAKVLHMGDDFFNKIIPFIDVTSGGSARGYLAAIDKVARAGPGRRQGHPGTRRGHRRRRAQGLPAVHRRRPRRGAARRRPRASRRRTSSRTWTCRPTRTSTGTRTASRTTRLRRTTRADSGRPVRRTHRGGRRSPLLRRRSSSSPSVCIGGCSSPRRHQVRPVSVGAVSPARDICRRPRSRTRSGSSFRGSSSRGASSRRRGCRSGIPTRTAACRSSATPVGAR